MTALDENVFQMTNAELIGLAKNRFIDTQTLERICILSPTLDFALRLEIYFGTRRVM